MEYNNNDCSPLQKIGDKVKVHGNGQCIDFDRAFQSFSWQWYYHWANEKPERFGMDIPKCLREWTILGHY